MADEKERTLEQANNYKELSRRFKYMLIRVSEGLDSMSANHLAFAEDLPKSVTDPKSCVPEELPLRVLQALQERGRFNPLKTAGLEDALTELNKINLLEHINKYKQHPIYKKMTKQNQKHKSKDKKSSDSASGNGETLKDGRLQDLYILTQSQAGNLLKHLEMLRNASGDSLKCDDTPHRKEKAFQALSDSDDMLQQIKNSLQKFRKEFGLAPSGNSDSSIDEESGATAQSPLNVRRNGLMPTENSGNSIDESVSPASSPLAMRKKPIPKPRRRMSGSPLVIQKVRATTCQELQDRKNTVQTPVTCSATINPTTTSPLEYAVSVIVPSPPIEETENTGSDSGIGDIDEWRKKPHEGSPKSPTRRDLSPRDDKVDDFEGHVYEPIITKEIAAHQYSQPKRSQEGI